MEKYLGLHFNKISGPSRVCINIFNETKNVSEVSEKIIDLSYINSIQVSESKEDFIFWWKVNSEDKYRVSFNADATSTNDSSRSIEFKRFIIFNPFSDNSTYKSYAILKNINNGATYEYQLSDIEETDLYQTEIFVSDGLNNTFLFNNGEAVKPLEFSIDAGQTWINANDSWFVTWGNNAPNFNNQSVDSSGHFAFVILNTPPSNTDYVRVRWQPKVDTCQFKTVINNPVFEDEIYKVGTPFVTDIMAEFI